MGSILGVVPIVSRRVRANGRLLIAVVIGAVLAAAIMSTMSIYTDAIRELGLSYALDERGEDAVNITVTSSSQSSQPEAYQSSAAFYEQVVGQYLGKVQTGAITRIGRSSTFFPTAPGAASSDDPARPRSHFNFVSSEVQEHLDIEGRWPAVATTVSGVAPSVEVAVGVETAQRLGISMGDRFDLHPFWVPDAAPVRVTVVALVSEKDPEEAYWIHQTDLLTLRTSSWDTIPFLIPEESFFLAIAGYLPAMVSDYTYLTYIDTGAITARNADSVARSVAQFQSAIASNLSNSGVETELPDVLASYDEKLFFTRIPMLVLVLQVAAIVLYYLFMVSTMLVERQTGEIALLKSRGATTPQVMRIYAVEGLIISAIALFAGPPIAAAVIGILGRTPSFSDLTGGSNLDVTLRPEAYLWAAAGALLAFVTLLVPAFLATRRTIVNQRAASARPAQQAFFMRYYLDVGLAGLGGILLYQIDRRGGLITDGFFGDQSIDPVMLLAPAFFILTVGIVFLRLFPVVLRLLAWVVARAQGASILIGMWQLVRNPVHYSRLVLLLMLATAVGMFAASFGATLETSYAARASYESGSNVRLADLRTIPSAGPAGLGTDVAQRFGAEHGSGVHRLNGSQGSLLSRVSMTVLGVDTDTFGDVAYYRSDFSGASLDSMLEKLREGRPERVGVDLPTDARWLGVWVNAIEMPSAYSLQFEVVDATGRYFSYLLGPDDVREMRGGWYLLVSDLSRPGTNFGGAARRNPAFDRINGPYPILEPQTPLTLTSITLRSPTRAAAPLGRIQFDDLQTSSQASIGADLEAAKLLFDPQRSGPGLPGGAVLVDFDSAEGWVPVKGTLPNPLNDTLSPVASGSFNGLELAWQPQPGSISLRGIQFEPGNQPIPVLGSESFLDGSSLQIGDVVSIYVNSLFFDVQIVDSYALFPTLGDGRLVPSLVIDGPTMAAAVNANPGGPLEYPIEVWLGGGSPAAALSEALESGAVSGRLVSLDGLREAQQKDPLIAAGWEGILFISFAAILILSAIGFLIYSYLTAQRRTLEFAVLRTMGFSKRQIATVVAFEQVFVIGLGMIAGTLMGMRLGSLMIRYMGLTETGDQVLPPMQLEINWVTVGTAWLVLGLVFFATISAVVLLYSRLALHRVLRIGET